MQTWNQTITRFEELARHNRAIVSKAVSKRTENRNAIWREISNFNHRENGMRISRSNNRIRLQVRAGSLFSECYLDSARQALEFAEILEKV